MKDVLYDTIREGAAILWRWRDWDLGWLGCYLDRWEGCRWTLIDLGCSAGRN